MGDRVLIYMPMSIQVVVAMQARASARPTQWYRRLLRQEPAGTHHRCRATEVITADGQLPRRRDSAQARGRRGVRHGWVREGEERHRVQAKREQGADAGAARQVVGGGGQEPARYVRAGQRECGASALHPLHLGLYREAQGIQHSTGGFLLWCALTMKWVFDNKPNDVFWCTADVGWVTGHSYITYAPTGWARPR